MLEKSKTICRLLQHVDRLKLRFLLREEGMEHNIFTGEMNEKKEEDNGLASRTQWCSLRNFFSSSDRYGVSRSLWIGVLGEIKFAG